MKIIKPQDLLVLLKLLQPMARKIKAWQLAHALNISQSELSQSLERCRASRLLWPSERKPIKSALKKCLLEGVQYFFAVEPGGIVRGIPTAQSAKPLSDSFNQEEMFVWPHYRGQKRGQSVAPLYKSIPNIVSKDQALYELLALVDALRLGHKGRVYQLAIQELNQRIDRAFV